MTRNQKDRRSLPTWRERKLQLAAATAVAALCFAAPALANPQGGEVTAGSATITNPNASTTQINQTTNKAIINWKSFNIDAGEKTIFVQPGAASITLNRIFDSNPSVIAGLLTANGRLVLINRNGMMFESGSRIDSAGLIASSADISDENFLAGRYQFDIAGNPNAKITNAGSIVVKPQGMVAIVAPTVENTGLIMAKLGRVGVGAGSTFILDIQGENLVGFPINPKLAEQLAGPGGLSAGADVIIPARAVRSIVDDVMKLPSDTVADGAQQMGAGVRFTGSGAGSWLTAQGGGHVALGGTIDVSGAHGGSISVTGDTVMQTGTLLAGGTFGGGSVDISARNLLTSGRIDLDAPYGPGGAVNLNASNRLIATSSSVVTANGGTQGGSVRIAGGADAGQGLFSSGMYSATSANGVGGTVDIAGRDVKLVDAKVDVSGATGGGKINIGFAGEGATRIIGSDTILASPTSTFKADATKSGNGGAVTFWSNLSSDFMGTMSAKGGALSGDGGLLEVSSKGDIGFWGLGDASAAHGAAGKLSLDPKNLIISNTGSTLPAYQLLDPNASANDLFGGSVAILSTGNTVVTAAQDDFGAANAGAVYVFNTTTGALVSTLTGSRANDNLGSGGITTLTNGNAVVVSPNWDLNAGTTDVGAVTFVNGTTGLSGAVSSANSLVGSTTSDQVGSSGVVALTNGSYVVRSPNWDNAAIANAGAATWGSGTTGISGSVSSANSLVGSVANDNVSGGGVTALTNGNFVVASPNWDNGGTANAGAATWGNGTTGRYGPGAVFGAITSANSLIGSAANNSVGSAGVVALTNGNFVVLSPLWDGAGTDRGAATWGNGATGATVGTVGTGNSIVGGASNDNVGSSAVALTNGNYVVVSPNWDNGGNANVGAVTWASGTAATAITVGTGNSVVGGNSGNPNDQVGSGGVTALTNGNYVISSPNFDAGPGNTHGAATWASGTATTAAQVSSANSLVGSTTGDNVSGGGIVALSNGNFVVLSPNWDLSGGVNNSGAATWGNGTTGRYGPGAVFGAVSSANSLVGSTSNNQVGSAGALALTNGNYVVLSPLWDGAGTDRGAATWGNGSTGAVVGNVGTGNSLVGTTNGDNVGASGVALTNGNYVIASPNWDNGATTNVGAVTWGSGTAATATSVGAGNSLIGSTANDQVGSGGVVALSNGNYAVSSPLWDIADIGAVTLGVGSTGTTGAVATTNSIYGGAASAQITYAGTNSTATEIGARSSAAGLVYVGLTDPAQVTFSRAQAQTLTVNPLFLTRTLDTGTAVTLQASNDITISSAITANNPTGNGGALTLQAGRSVLINANITTDNGNLTIVANELLANGVVDAQRDAGAAAITMASGTTINAGTGNVRLTIASGAGKTQTASGALTLSNVTAGTLIAENLGPSNGNVVINAGSTLAASGAGTPLVLASQGGNFINNAGAGALSTPSGRWIVYSQTPTANTNGGLAGSPYYNTTYNSANPTGLSATGNRFAYTTAPVLTVTANNLAREYGDANPTLTYGITGLIGGDTLAGAVSGAPNLSTAANATSSVSGSPYTITTAIGTLASDYNYGFSLVNGLLTINPATLTYVADPASRLYGDANPAFTGTVTGFKNSETVATATTGTLSFTSPATATSNVGSHAINGSGLTAINGNYVFTQAVGNATALTINPSTLTYVADPASRLYGDPNPAFTGTVTGFKNGQTIATATTGALTFTSPAIATSNVGSYVINGSGLTANNGNYVFVQDPGNATALTINPSTLTYVADPKSRLYGDANPALTGTVSGFKNGETIATATTGTLAFATPAVATSNVGSYAINGSGLTANNGNYVFAQDPGNATALTINPSTLTYVADPKSRLYGDANPALTGTVTGFKNGETIATATTGALAFTTTATTTTNVGSYAIDGSGLTANNGNYVFAQDAGNATALTIDPSTLTYVADPASRLYGDANPAFTGTVTGFKNSETIATATTGALTFTSPAIATSNVGAYAIDGSGLTANNGNYVFVQDAGNATALTINPSTLTYVADPKSRLYGDANPALTGTVTGFKNSETIATATTGALTFTTPAVATSNVGAYAIDGSGLTANNGNYVFVQDAGNATALTINPSTLTYVADPKSRLYGAANPALTGAVTGFKNGETIATATTGALAFTTTATATTNVGSYAIDGSGLSANFGNYVFVQDAGNATALTINPSTLTYVADPASRLYGDPNPASTGAVTGFKNGETIASATTGALTFTTPAVATSNVGSYAIDGSGLTANNGNYVFVQDAGNATALTINPSTLTYVSDPKSRLYGDANPALTGTVAGFKNGETVATATTGALTFTTPAVATSNVGAYSIDGSGLIANNGNYVFVQDAGNATALTINPSTLTYVADPKSRLYGDANPALTGTVTGFKNSETIATATTGALGFTTPATATSNVGSYAINGSGLTANFGNYVFAQDPGNATALTINPSTLTYVADPKSRLYGDANPALTGTVTGFKNGETIATATTGALTFTTPAVATSNVGSHAIDGSGLAANNGNYVFVQDTGNATALTINPSTLTYVADPASRLYGDANPALTGTVTGFKNGETIATATTGTLDFTTAAAATSNVGSYAIDGSGLAANFGNYVFAQDAGNATALTINPATLTYIADPASRLYGDPNPPFTGTVAGFKNGETIASATTGALTFASPATATSNVGSHAINGGGLSANFGNYVFAQDPGNATALTINPSTLTYVADPKSRLYGDANPALTGTVTGFKNGETIASATTGALAFTTTATATTNVGSYAIDGSGLAANNGNYVFVQAAGNATALTINPATLTYAADPKSRLYGDPNPALTGTVTGFKNGETVATATTGALAFTTPATATSNVGSYAINGSGLIANNGNYIFVQGAGNATALTINPATLTYIADPASRLYGDANPAFTGTVSGFKNGETVATATTGALTFTSPATATSNVGAYAINGSGLAANNGNYVFVQDPGNATALTINAATLTYVADPKSRLYGDANPALTGTVTGFKNGETIASATTGALTFTTPATATSNVGSYAIDGSGLSANNGNYVFVQDAGNAAALTINPATLTYVADPQSRLYGDPNPALTGTVTGFKNGETVASATTGALAFTTPATATSNVGAYAINGSGLTANNGNYVFVQDAGNATALTINPATLTYIADPASRLYGDPNPALTGSVAGFKNGETVATATTGAMTFTSPATATSNVGLHAINGSGLTANFGNYVFAQDPGNATALTINPSTLTYVADPKSRLYGDANPALTGTVTGFKNGETIASATTGALAFTTPATATSNVGTYSIDGSGLTANNGNYVFVQAAGNATALTINPATLTYVADPKSRLYGDANPALTGTVNGFKNGETVGTATTGALTFTTPAVATSNVGSYAINGSGLTANNGNYVFVQDAGNATALTIDPSTLTYVADPASRLYGDPNPAFTGTVTGFKNGETIATATGGTLIFTSPATGTAGVGTHAINGSGLTANNGNYVFVQAAGNANALTINPSTLTYLADPKSRLYGAANPALTGTVTGFKNGETIATATTGTLAFTTAANATSGVGSYAIDGSGLTAANYVFVQDPSNATALTINPATLSYVADPKSRLYGDPNPALTGTVTGFKNGETVATATSGALTFTTGATATSNVGSYAINGSGLTAANYVFVQDPGNATALTIDPSTLTYVADPASRLYGDANPAFTGTVTGFKNGETVATATGGTLTFTSPATGTAGVGTHAINGGGLTANNGNYVFVQAAGNANALTINPATLTYLADPKSRLYGDANPALTGTVTGFKNGETIASATTGTLAFATTANATSGVGSYGVTGSGLTAANYVFVQDPSNATALTINPATLTYVADPKSRLYGDANPALTGTVTGFKNSETIATATSGALTFTTGANATSNVGAYAINGSGLTAGNYVFVQAAGNATALTINPATLTYVADPATRLYFEPNPAFTGTVTGFKNGQTIATATTGTLTFATPANLLTPPGAYAINGSGLAAVNGNYVFTQAAGNATALTINPNPNAAVLTTDFTPVTREGQTGEDAMDDEESGLTPPRGSDIDVEGHDPRSGQDRQGRLCAHGVNKPSSEACARSGQGN